MGPYYHLDVAAFAAKDPAERLYESHPELLEHTDTDGLLYVAAFEATPQVLIHRGNAVPYHRFLWRNFDGNVNDGLIQTLLELAGAGSATVRIALNEQNFMPASAFVPYLERDFWWGPHLSLASLDNPRQLGVTVHADPKSGLLHEYPRLFVDWAMDKEGHKVVQIEELSDTLGSRRLGLRILRYLHAIRDVNKGIFIHCDGAVRAYTEEQYRSRSEKHYVTGRESAELYRKVFRVDGEVDTDAWSNIAARWFRGNRLMGEYLSSLAAPRDPEVGCHRQRRTMAHGST